ncbi:glycosyltransferase family 4 protein [Anthocerotibacter panamensis]|uniref:glycosyltransferase family 4 protein n=1 Tax=Anthocerotibacter panamensis TaxID=2857077 RepID=UPI001C4036D7|nr:glycosyltransferase family 4 protein [Anthocerotibacter panamensis]
MKILALTWEFPPRIVGGIARHVAELYPEIVALGHEVHLLTVEFGDAPAYEVVDGIHIYRLPVAPSNGFFDWVVKFNDAMGLYGGKLIKDAAENAEPFEVLHAHDWLVGDAAIALKRIFRIPLVATIHATEYGRNNGIRTEVQRYIHGKENLLTFEAWRVIVCTEYMKGEVNRAFLCPEDKVDVIANGIRAEKKQLPDDFDRASFRRHFAYDHEKIVYYVGRMAYEKGVQVLVEAMPKVLWEYPATKFVIIGGGNTSAYRRRVDELGVTKNVYFTGFMQDEDLDKFQTVADCAVFPSLYEPFGIVVLESFAAGVPVVVSNSGGLPEVVTHTKTGIVTQVNDPVSLAYGILEVVRYPDYAQWLRDNGRAQLEHRFLWPALAAETMAVLDQVVTERKTVAW